MTITTSHVWCSRLGWANIVIHRERCVEVSPFRSSAAPSAGSQLALWFVKALTGHPGGVGEG